MKSVERFLAVLMRFFERLGTWVAGFTFWRFIVFSILMLIAASIVGDLVFNRDTPAVVTVAKDQRKAEKEPAQKPHAAKANGEADNAARCTKDVRIGWSGIHVSKHCGDASPTTQPDQDASIEAPEVSAVTAHADLADWMLAVLAVLWIVWFAGRARLKAEARADHAEAVAEKEGLERQVAEARLQALQAQVEPHFLFNTLGAVEHLIETDPPRAATMQRHLIAFLRGAMPRMRSETVTLGDEVELCRNYLAIMKIRMEDRLDYSIDLPPELARASFPPLMLQSVVENAVKHGLEPKAEGGSILISARAAAGRLRVAVADNGLGFGVADTAGTGIGLNNIRERLAGLFGDNAALVISPNAPTGAQVAIEIPYEPNNGNHR